MTRRESRAERPGRPTLLLCDASVQAGDSRPPHHQALDTFVDRGVLSLLASAAWRYSDVALRTYDVGLMRKPFEKALLLRMLSRGRCWFEDASGQRVCLSAGVLLRLLYRRIRAGRLASRGRQAVKARLYETVRRQRAVRKPGPGPALYLRTDLVFGVRSGGSVTHVAGVLNELHRLTHGIRFVTSDAVPTVDAEIETHHVPPDPRILDLPESCALHYNLVLDERLVDLVGGAAPAFVYQRYSLNNIAGLLLAERHASPFVLEYNGSEVWINRHWGRPLGNERLAHEIEQTNLRRADLVVVVSEALASELYARGVDRRRVLVNPNGVDPQRYRPDLPAEGVRSRHDLEGLIVIGFIGTFGPWHGAEVLVDAFARLLEGRADLRARCRLLMIGDGQRMPAVRSSVGAKGIGDRVVLAGRIAQHEGPAHLAACDVLVSPHVPNSDGSAFFGSPTKLFEYMATGRAIVASDLGQIGEVLDHGQSALLVPPGDPEALAGALARLADDPVLAGRLGRRAREVVLQRHTWRRHTGRILDRLEQIVGARFG